MGSLMHKRCLKRRILEETNAVRTCGTTTNKTDQASKPAKRCRPSPDVSSIACARHSTTDTHTVKAHKPHVSFSPSPAKVVLIDGLGSDIIKRQRCEIWYTVSCNCFDVLTSSQSSLINCCHQREDYRVFWRDRIDSVRLWQMVYGGEHGENDDSDLEMLLDEQFTVRGLENYTTDQSTAKVLDPKKNNYIQTVLREQQQNAVVEPNVIRRLAGKVTRASLERAQKIAMQDAREAHREALGCVSPEGRSFSIGAKPQQQCESPPISPASVVEFDMARTSKKAELRQRVLAHMDKSSGNHQPQFQPRRCSMQMHARKGQHMVQQRRMSQERHPMQQRAGHRRPSLPPVNFYPYQQQQEATPMIPSHENHAAGQYQQQQYYEHQSYGPRGLRRDSMGMCYGGATAVAEPMLQHRFETPDAAVYENHYQYGAGANPPPHRMLREEAGFASGLTFSPRHKSTQPVRRQSLQGSYGNDSYPRYETYVGEYSGMRRDSLGGHYSAHR